MPGTPLLPARPGSVTGTVALVLACLAVGLAVIAAPGGLVWLTIWIPALGVPNEGLLSILANLVTIPAAVLSWAAASTCSVIAIVTLTRASGTPRKAVIALAVGAPGSILGTAAMVMIVSHLGLLPTAGDARRHRDVDSVAAQLALPQTGTGASRCETAEGPFKERRVVSVLEKWNPERVDQIRSRLQIYSETSLRGPTASSDRQQLHFEGTDGLGNYLTVHISRFAPHTKLNLGCGNVTMPTETLRTVIYLEDH